ncbi:MAG: GGDEF domain-containing protein [Isosphaeraceae bacterium]|nr:GGDEF domain-containing protein [Isosphaeraceae bacterium]
MRDPQTVLAASSEHRVERGVRPTEQRHPFLVVLEGGISGELLRLDPRGSRLGRAADNSIVLYEPGISRHHALIRLEDDGTALLTDQGSSNGTQINSEPLPRGGSATIEPGDTIRFGPNFVARFALLDPDEERYQQAIYDRSVRDPLTRLHNRMYFLSNAGYKLSRDPGAACGLALVMIDVDRFKAVNDTYGHSAGDRVLRELAAVLHQSTRPNDVLARYGGEEFLVAINVPTIDLATMVAERIRANVAARVVEVSEGDPSKTSIATRPLPGPVAEILRSGGTPPPPSPSDLLVDPTTTIRVTISIGVAFAPAGYRGTLPQVISVADRCLYQAKSRGRNQVVSCEITIPAGPKG